MKNKFKMSLKRTCILFYLIILIIIIFCATIILFFCSIDNKHSTTNKSNEITGINLVKENPIRINFSSWNKTCDWELIVVNGDNEIPSNFETKLKKYGDVEVDERIIPDLENMIKDAAAQNISIELSSGYRSFEKQNNLFKKKISENIQKGYALADATTLAEGIVARPGTSEHHGGFAIDLNGVCDDFCHTDTYNWLIKNSYNYGFILRYKSEKQRITGKIYEPWHFRYVGKVNAKSMEEKCMCLEEYVSSLISQQ